MTGRAEQIQARLYASTPGPWERAYAVDYAGETEPAKDKPRFLALSLNDDSSTLWLVEGDGVIPAVTGDGPRAKANAELIANAPTDLAWLLAERVKLQTAIDAVEALHVMEFMDDLLGEGTGVNHCYECGYEPDGDEPCPTIEALRSHLGRQ